MFGREKEVELKLAQESKPEPQLTEAEVRSVKEYHSEQIKKKRLEEATGRANDIVYGGMWHINRLGIAWCTIPIPGIAKSLKLTKTQKEQIKAHIACWLNEADWFKPE